MTTPALTPITTRARRTAGALLAVGALTTALAGCTGTAEDAESEKRDFGPVGDRLTISAGNGDLDVRPADVDNVAVTRWVTGWSAIGATPQATWELSGDTLDLATECGFPVLGRCEVRYEVLVPEGTALTVETDNGQVTATGFGAALDVTTDNGGIRVKDASGTVALTSSSGTVRATGIDSKSVTAASDNGRIHLSFAGVPDQVEATAQNGAVTVEVPKAAYNVATTTDNGDVRNDLSEAPDSPHTITATTDNGPIALRIAD